VSNNVARRAVTSELELDEELSDACASSDKYTSSWHWLLLAAVFVSWLISLAILYWQVRYVDFALPMQNYDSATHNSLVRGMVDRGTISPFGFRNDIDLYGYDYPLGFTTVAYFFVGVFGVTGPVGIAMAWGLGAAVLWPLGCAFLVHAMVPDRIMPAALAPVVSMCFAQYPLGLLSFGTLYPYGLASSLLPWLMGVSVLFIRAFSWRHISAAVFLILLVAYTQPRVAFTYLLASGAFWTTWWYGQYWRNQRSRLIDKVWLPVAMLLAAGGALLYAYVRFGDKLFDTSQWSFSPAVMAWKHAIATYLSGASYVDPGADLQLSWTMIALVAFSVTAVAFICPRERWLLAGWFFIGVVYCCAAAGEAILPRVISLPWYRQELRIYAAYPSVMVPMICVACGALGVRIARVAGRFGQGVSVFMVAICATGTALFSPGVAATADSVVTVSAQPGGMLDAAKTRFYEECVPIVGQDLVAADPWSGAMFAYSQFNVNQYFNTFGPRPRHWGALARMDEWGLIALRDFGVMFVMDLGPVWSEFNGEFSAYVSFHDKEKYRWLEPVLSVWDPYLNYNLTLYRIPIEA
jgi:hypothetical protein